MGKWQRNIRSSSSFGYKTADRAIVGRLEHAYQATLQIVADLSENRMQ